MNYDQWKRERPQNEWARDIEVFERYKNYIKMLKDFSLSKKWAEDQIQNYRALMQEIKNKYPSHLKNEDF